MSVELEVIQWAQGLAVEFQQPTDIEEHLVFVTMLIRLRASMDLKWAWHLIEHRPEQLIGWSPCLRTIVVGGVVFPNDRMTWVEWFAAVRDLEAA